MMLSHGFWKHLLQKGQGWFTGKDQEIFCCGHQSFTYVLESCLCSEHETLELKEAQSAQAPLTLAQPKRLY